jgi:hypothetical protein
MELTLGLLRVAGRLRCGSWGMENSYPETKFVPDFLASIENVKRYAEQERRKLKRFPNIPTIVKNVLEYVEKGRRRNYNLRNIGRRNYDSKDISSAI